jgi:hypothetical protein
MLPGFGREVSTARVCNRVARAKGRPHAIFAQRADAEVDGGGASRSRDDGCGQ